MRLVWSLAAAIGLLVGAGLAYERFTPPEEATQPTVLHEVILTGGTAQPAPAAEPAPPIPTRLPPAAPARGAPSVQLPGPVAPPLAAAVSSTAETSQPGVARAGQPAEPSAVQARDEAPPAPAAVADGARADSARPTPAEAGSARDDVARPHPTRPKVDAPRVSAPTPTPCVLEPPPRYLDGAARAPEK